MSLWNTSSVTDIAPALAQSWFTAIAVSLITFIHGATPPETHFTPLIVPPLLLIFPIYTPIPPPYFDI